MAKPIGIDYVQLNATPTPTIFVDYFNDWTDDPESLYVPHRHAYHELLWFQAGHGMHRIDDRLVPIMASTLTLIAQGQVHSFREVKDLAGYAVCFTDDFLGPQTPLHTPSYRTVFNYLHGDQTLAIPPDDRADTEALLDLIVREYARTVESRDTPILHHLVHALLLQIERMSRRQQQVRVPITPTQDGLYWSFVHLLEQHFSTHHNVGFYAQALHCTPDQLSSIIHAVLGKPTKRVIADRVLLEARRHLQFTTLSIKEIAHALGFADPFHFSKRFKQGTGLAPQAYRQQHVAN